MKKNKIYTLWLILLSFGMAGCSEEEVNLRLEEQGCVLTKVEQVSTFYTFTETYTYNESGNITLVTRAGSENIPPFTKRAFYDLKGRLSYILTYNANEVTPYSKTVFSYNEKGQMIKYNYFLITQEATSVSQVTFKYDDQGRFSSINYYDRGDNREYDRYEYDVNNNPVSVYVKFVNSNEILEGTYSFDLEKRNPFYLKNLSNFFIISGADSSVGNLIIFYLSEFQIKQRAALFQFGGTSNFTAEYNEQNYPTVMIASGGGINYTNYLEYQCK